MKIKLLEQHGNLKPGAEWNCPWAAVARKLIEEGKALAIEAADLHLNPTASEDATPEVETSAAATPGESPAEASAATKTRIKRKVK